MIHIKIAFFSLTALVTTSAQVAPFQSAAINLAGTSTQLVAVPAGNSPTLSSLVIDASSAGGDLIDVAVGDPSVVISLITPAGTQINASNAAGFGFTFSTYTLNTSSSDIPDPLGSAGTHTVIYFSSGQTAGTYQIQADASAATADTGMIVQYYSSSTVQAGAVTDSSTYRLGDLVIASALLFDGTTPIQGATVTATAATLVPVQASVGNYQLVSQQAVSSTLTLYNYTAQVTNSGGAVTNVSAQVSSSDPNTTIVDGTVIFGNVAAGGTATSLNTFSVQLPSSATFDPSVLSWQVSTPSASVSFALLDSGTYDAATGDGIYTGTFTPPVTGNYLVYITASGLSSSGVPFSRTTTTSLEVDAPLAQLGTFSDAPVYDSNGLITQVAITAAVNVQVAGTYRLTLDLQASNGKTTEASASAQLSTGTQQIVLNFPFSNLLSLGTDGPYAEIRATLLYVSGSNVTLADYVANAGMTQSYTQASISPGPVAFTGQNTATGIVTGSGPTYDLLQVTIGIYSSSAGSCSWSAMLTDLSGNEISFVSASGNVPAGTSSVTLDFNGNLLAQSAGGPYLIKNAAVQCGGPQILAGTLFQTQSFSPPQFTFVPADFTLAVQTSPPPAAPGSPFLFRVSASSVGVLSAPISLAVSGLPAGAAVSFTVPSLLGFGISYLKVGVSLGTAAGSYPLTITGRSGVLVHSVSATLVISQAPIPNGVYTLTNGASNLLLTDPDAPTTSGTQIVQSSATGGPEQQWQFAIQTSGYYTIQNVSSQFYLTDPGESATPGAQLEQMFATYDDSQLWSVNSSGGAYSICNKATGLAIDDANWSTNIGNGMDLWTPTGNANQNWSIQ